jgi:hypothetical protein
MPSEFENIYYAVSANGYVLINDNSYDYSQDDVVIGLMKIYKRVVLGDKFTQPVDFLPEEITHLQLGRRFNQPIMNLPRSLKHLVIASNEISYCDFNQSLDYLPDGLESLTIKLNQGFRLPIDNLPRGLKHLHFICKNFIQPINNLPEGLQTLVIAKFDYNNTYNFPVGMKTANITYQITDDEYSSIKKNLIEKYPNINFDMNEPE